MNEPLDWERWSSFSHNRIREDVQKHSRPGAVAEKKAFFEAYFSRFASKKSAKPPKKENRPPNYSPQTHVSPVTISNNKENHPPTVATDENMRNKGAESEITSNQDVSSPSPLLPKTENVDDIISNTCLVEQEKTLTENVSSPIVPSNTEMERDVDEIANVDEKPSTNLGEENISDVEENVSSDKGTEGETTSKKDVCSSTTNLVISEVKNIDDIISSGGQVEQEKTSTGNVSSEKRCSEVKISISNQSSHVDRNKKRQIKDKKATQTKTEISSVKSSSRKAPIPEIHPKNQIFKHNPMVI
ncbi:putative protein WVD2-like 7 [Helianthus annuus]|nr:putative protein WVD2-like 7 [Helianthus annuus]